MASSRERMAMAKKSVDCRVFTMLLVVAVAIQMPKAFCFGLSARQQLKFRPISTIRFHPMTATSSLPFVRSRDTSHAAKRSSCKAARSRWSVISSLLSATPTDDKEELESPMEAKSLTDDDSHNMLPVHDDANDAEPPVSKPSTGQAILDLAIPALGALLIDPLMTLADTAFVGHYSVSATSLAGMGSAAALLTFCFYLFNFLTTATTPLVASRRAAGQETAALAVGGQALSLALGLGAMLTTGIIVFKQPLLEIMGTGITGPEANDYANGFLLVRALAAPAVLSISASMGILRGYLDTRTPIIILVVANAINLILDVLLIVQAKLGPVGAAWATTTAEWITALLFLGVLAGELPSAGGRLGSNQLMQQSSEKKTSENVLYNPINGRNGDYEPHFLTITPSASIPSWHDIQPLVVASSSVFLRSLVLQISLSAAAAMAARGVEADGSYNVMEASANVAAHQIAIQLWLFCSFLADALAAASQGLVADALGRQDGEAARDISRLVLTYSVGLGLVLTAMLQLGASTNALFDFFTQDMATQKALSHILILIIVAQPLNSFVFSADGILQGASEFVFQAKSMALSGAVAAGAFLLLQYYSHGSDTLFHVWSALIVLMFMRGLTSVVKMVDKNGPIDILNLRER